MRTKDDFILESHRAFALAQPNRPNPWTVMLPREPDRRPPAAYDSIRGHTARDDEERDERIDRLVDLLESLSEEDGREAMDRMHRRLGRDRARRVMDRLRARDIDPLDVATMPLSREDERTIENDHARAMDRARREVAAACPGLAMDRASSPEGVFALGALHLGVNTAATTRGNGRAFSARRRRTARAAFSICTPVPRASARTRTTTRSSGGACRASGDARSFRPLSDAAVATPIANSMRDSAAVPLIPASLPREAHRRRAGRRARSAPRFGRVESFDVATGCGIILGADGSEAVVTAAALARAGVCNVSVGAAIEFEREQAKIVHRYIAGYFREVPLLHPLVQRETDDGLELANNVEVVVATNSYRSVRGRSIAVAILDEAAFWRSDESASPDVETYSAILPAMVTLPGAILVLITTAYRRAGLAYQKWHQHFGKPSDDVLVVYGPSTAFNPSLPQSVIDAALERDAEAAGAEWLSQWRSDLSDFLDRELIDGAVDPSVVVRPPQPSLPYTAFADPSGGRGDSFTLAIAHAQGNAALLDCLYERRAPFDPSVVVAEIAALLRDYGLAEVTGDKYAAQWVVEAFAKEGIGYRQSERDRSALYLDALPLFTAGRVRLLDNARLVNQLASLERRTSRNGKDRVNHPPGGADDVANAAAGALVSAAADAAPALSHASDLLIGGAPVPMPARTDYVLATPTVDASGRSAVIYWARNRHTGHPLTLLDFDARHFREDMFAATRDRLVDLAASMRNAPAFIYCDAVLAAQFVARGIPASDIDGLTDDVAALALTAAANVSAGKVRIAAPAHAKAAQHPLGTALSFSLHKMDDPLALSAMRGVVLALDATGAARRV